MYAKATSLSLMMVESEPAFIDPLSEKELK
jgi:hypothetical protein